MKTSVIIIAALFLNTTLLVSEPLAALVKGINPWILAAIESVLLLVYFLNVWLKDLNKSYAIELGYLNIFVLKDPKK